MISHSIASSKSATFRTNPWLTDRLPRAFGDRKSLNIRDRLGLTALRKAPASDLDNPGQLTGGPHPSPVGQGGKAVARIGRQDLCAGDRADELNPGSGPDQEVHFFLAAAFVAGLAGAFVFAFFLSFP